MIADVAKLDPYRKFGIDTSSTKSANVLGATTNLSEHERFTLGTKEQIYETNRREPLGKSYQRGHVLPKECQASGFAFGLSKPETNPEGAKGIIYPHVEEDPATFKAMYQKSHGISEPGEQKNRNYRWEATQIQNPSKFKFGLMDKTLVRDGVATCLNPVAELGRDNASKKSSSTLVKTIVAKQVESMKDTFDQMGQARHLGTCPAELLNRSSQKVHAIFGLFLSIYVNLYIYVNMAK